VSEKKSVQGTPNIQESITAGGERRSQFSAEISTAAPGNDYTPPPMSMDAQQTSGKSD
jgi:hypothetical protein